MGSLWVSKELLAPLVTGETLASIGIRCLLDGIMLCFVYVHAHMMNAHS